MLYARNANTAFAPASVLKVVVAGTVLRDPGPDYRFTTRLVTDVAPQDDTLPGSLWLVGSGDPELTSADLKRAVAAMKAAGILRIDGDVIADGSLFGPDAVNPTWAADDLEYGYAALASAVTMDGGTAQFTITPDPNGGVARVRADPDAIAGELVGDVRTGPADAENTLRIDPLPDGNGFQLSGTIPYGAPQKYWRSLAHPTQSAAVALRAMLIDAGIGVGGGIAVGQAPNTAVTVWTRRSRPLAAIIRRMMFDSDNHIAEQLLRTAGAQRFGTGSLPNGLEAEREYLQGIGAGQAWSGIADASGLSTADRLSAQTAATVLRDLVSDPDAATNAALLPRVGVEGTVHVRDIAPDVRGRVLGKDGYIEGVSSLAGYVKTEHHGLVIYAFLVNGWERGLDAVWSSEDDYLSRLARY
jgi:D-alanyl-D-alanine carboxypeptidase/D-alanyl-D-alanine-endopeptidase (penicillin-binding protein 4)